MDSRMARDLDNYITGHYGEDQFKSPAGCTCGHVEEEHCETGECEVPGCLCACFELDESA